MTSILPFLFSRPPTSESQHQKDVLLNKPSPVLTCLNCFLKRLDIFHCTKSTLLEKWGRQKWSDFLTFVQQKFIVFHLYTVNISAVKITVFRCVPFPAVLLLYFLHCTTAPITVEKCKHWFTVVYCNIYTSTL